MIYKSPEKNIDEKVKITKKSSMIWEILSTLYLIY